MYMKQFRIEIKTVWRAAKVTELMAEHA